MNDPGRRITTTSPSTGTLRATRCALVLAAVSTCLARAQSQELVWRAEQFGPHRMFAMCADLWRDRLVAHSNGRTLEWDGQTIVHHHSPHEPPSRYGHALAYDTDRRTVLLFGGRTSGAYSNDLWEYDGDDWTSRAVPASAVAPQGRSQLAMSYDLLRHRCVVFGGNGEGNLLFGDTWEWNGARWILMSVTGPGLRSDTAMAFHLASGETVLFGGADSMRLCNDTWAWNGVAWTQRSPVTTPPARAGHSMSADFAHAKVMMFGGSDNALWEWDGVNWTSGNSGPSTRAQCRIATDANGCTYVVGGQENAGFLSSRALSDVWRCEFGQWQQLKADEAPTRTTLATTYDEGNDQLLTIGPSEGFVPTMRLHTYDHGGWREATSSSEPSPNNFTRMCYDPAHANTVLFGGLNGFFPSNGTWLWNGKSWAAATSAAVVPPRFDHGMCYDRSRQEVLLFGGRTLGTTLQDTWLWDGLRWRAGPTAGPAAGPSARSGFGLACDEMREQIVLFGGGIFTGPSNGTLNNETWLWDGHTWTLAAVDTAPLPRAYHGMAFDVRRGLVVCAGGRNGSQRFAEVHEWNGKTWRGGSAAIPKETPIQLTYDRTHGRLQLIAPVLAGDMLGGYELYLGAPDLASARIEGGGCAGGTQPVLQPFGTPRLGQSSFRLDILRAQPLQPVWLGVGRPSNCITLANTCSFYLAAGSDTLQLFTDPSGFASASIGVPNCRALLGVEGIFQAGTIDAQAPLGMALTPSVHVRLGE